MGVIRTTVPESKAKKIACPHCGKEEWRTAWQAENRFNCSNCGKLSDEPVASGEPKN